MLNSPEKPKNDEKPKRSPRFKKVVWLSAALLTIVLLLVMFSIAFFITPMPVCGCTFEPYAGVTQTAVTGVMQTAAAVETLAAQAGS